MGRFSRKANKGSSYRTWQAAPVTPLTGLTRQGMRAALRETAWLQMSHPPMHDEGGIIPRWLRRAMALGLAKKMWQAKAAPTGPAASNQP